jgi:hypothetical protein
LLFVVVFRSNTAFCLWSAPWLDTEESRNVPHGTNGMMVRTALMATSAFRNVLRPEGFC